MKKHASLEKRKPEETPGLIENEQQIMELERILFGKQRVQKRIVESIAESAVKRLLARLPKPDGELKGQVVSVLQAVEVLREKLEASAADEDSLRVLEREVLMMVKEKLAE